MDKGRIYFDLDGLSFEQCEKLRHDIGALIQSGVFGIRNGNCTIHFDHDGTLQAIDIFQRKWKRVSKPEETARTAVFFNESVLTNSDDNISYAKKGAKDV